MASSVEIGELHLERDRPAIFAWLRSYLRWHLEVWSRTAGLYWDDAQITAHIEHNDLVERDWHELREAAQDSDQLVAVARSSGRPLGIIHANQRRDRYLCIHLWVICWIFVEPVSRGTGISGRLIRHSHEWMQHRGLGTAEVFVTAENRAAEVTYSRGGYRLVDHRLMARLTRD